MIRTKRCWLFWGLFAALMVLPTLAHAQNIKITRATYRKFAPNVWRYTIRGTADGVGNNYTVNLTIFDRFGVPISNNSVTVNNGSGTWARSWFAVGGGRIVLASLVDQPGIKDEVALDEESVLTEEVPALSDWGVAILILLLISTAFWILWRKRLATTT